MITLYLDMDGVLCDFNKEYQKLDPKKEDRKRFRQSVLEHKIFEKLDYMPDAHQLLNHVARLKNIDVQILTSMGTHDPFQAEEAKRQKLVWLKEHNINYRPNFVHDKMGKSAYARRDSILIDDSIGCIAPFISAGGRGILHVNAPDSIRILDSTILQLLSLEHA